MVAIKAAEFAFPRMEAPDLDAMEEFLTNFGMVRAERTPDALYMRGADSHHHLHAVHKGGTKFIGFAYHAASEDDLKRLAKLPGASGIETLNEPGGGKRVRLTEPNGYQIEVIYGMSTVPQTKVELVSRQGLLDGVVVTIELITDRGADEVGAVGVKTLLHQ